MYIQLSVPSIDPNKKYDGYDRIDGLKEELRVLPMLNAQSVADYIVNILSEYNLSEIPARKRFEFMEEIRPVAIDLVMNLRRSYIHQALPLGFKSKMQFEKVRHLLSSVALGYKHIISQLAHEQIGVKDLPSELQYSLFHALNLLSQIIAESYAVYHAEPDRVWMEIHQIYYYAERCSIHNKVFNAKADEENSTRTIYESYMRIVLLSLGDPYHMIQGEAQRAYDLLATWGGYGRIIPARRGEVPKTRLFIDLDTDMPPRYLNDQRGEFAPIEGRCLDVTPLLGLVKQQIHQLVKQISDRKVQQSMFNERLRRDMYIRLAQGWGVKRQRVSARECVDEQVALVSGLTVCHYFIRGKEEFKPEKTEHLLNHTGEPDNPVINLTTEENTPYHEAERLRKISADDILSKLSCFSNNTNDAWENVKKPKKKKRPPPPPEDHDTVSCSLINSTRSGVGVHVSETESLQVRVGDLVSYQLFNEEHQWCLGTVRWLRTAPAEGIRIGVSLIHGEVLPVATKGISGVGHGGEYFRALIVRNKSSKSHATSIITPAALYDIGSVILVNNDSKLLQLRLTRLLESTNSYAQFRFEPIRRSIF